MREILASREPVSLVMELDDRDAVVLLELSNELLAIAVDDIEVVVGELAPSRLGFAFILFPLPSSWSQFICSLRLKAFRPLADENALAAARETAPAR